MSATGEPPESGEDEITFLPACARCDCAMCVEKEEQATQVVIANARVLMVAGYSAALTPPVVLVLSWIDSLIKQYPWAPDERLLLAMVGAWGLLIGFYFKKRGEKNAE